MNTWVTTVALVSVVAVPCLAQPSAPAIRIEEDLRLDAEEEDFPAVSRVYVGPRGQIVVPILSDMQLRVYDATGKRLATVGRRGGGPGEFMGIGLVGWVGDTMWVSDQRQRRTVFVGPDYVVRSTLAWPQRQQVEGTMLSKDPVVFLPAGAAVLQAVEVSPGRRAVLLHRDGGGTEREILSQPTEDSTRTIWVGGYGFGVPFSLQPQTAFAPNGQRVARLSAEIPQRQNATFQVTSYAVTGEVLFRRDYAYRGTPIPRRVADSAIATLRPSPGHVANEADMANRVQAIARDRVSRWYIPAESITLGMDRTTWIGMRPTAQGRGYLILNARGDPVGSLVVPESTRIRQASATHIWVTETDDDGLSSVVRYRVSGLSCGAGGC